MKNQSLNQSSGPIIRAASPKFILMGLIAASASFVLTTSGLANGEVTLPPKVITVDGQFSPSNEWFHVNPDAFLSQPGGSALALGPGNPVPLGANTLLYASVAPATFGPDPTLHLMYDFAPRTTAISPGETFAKIEFPLNIPTGKNLPNEGTKQFVDVLFVGKQAGGGSFFDIFVDFDIFDGIEDHTHSNSVLGLGLLGAAGFGPSSLSTTNHLLVELEVGLRIQPGFGDPNGPLPGGGINPTTGLYDPNPVFWGASGAGNGTVPSPDGGQGGSGGALQSATAAMIEITRSGSLTVTPVPEPASAALLLAGLGAFAARRRK